MRENHVVVPRPRPGITEGWSGSPVGAGAGGPGPDGVDGFYRITSAGSTATYTLLAATLSGEGDTVYVIFHVRASEAVTLDLATVAATAGGSNVATTDLTPLHLAANAWTEVTAEIFAAAAFDGVSFIVGTASGGIPVDVTLDVTMAHVSTDPGDYFDGATPNELDEVGRGWVYEWTGQPWQSTSIERYGFAGLLSATWNSDWGAVHLVVDPGMWTTQDVQYIRIERTSPSEGTVPVRGIENLPAPGGGYIGTDHEMPINETVQYTVYGYDSFGALVDSSTAVVKPEVGSCILYVKAPGRPDMTITPTFRSRDSFGSATRGGVYQIAGGGAVAQDGGADTTTATITVRTQDAGEARALEGLLAAARTILIQHGGEPEIAPGWWFVSSWEQMNPAGKSFDVFSKRDYQLTLQATMRPAGAGVQFTGTTWGALIASHATWQDVMDAYPTWLDVILGEG